MTNRRELFRLFRETFVVSTIGGVVFKKALANGTAERPPSAVENLVAIADWSFVASAEFAEETARHGIGARGFDGDVGGLWLHTIEPKLRTGRAAVVGLSGAGVLFCLETLARSYGFGPVFRAERPQSGGPGWTRVATRHALRAAAAGGATMLEPFEHAARPAAPEAPLFAWTIARDARRTNNT